MAWGPSLTNTQKINLDPFATKTEKYQVAHDYPKKDLAREKHRAKERKVRRCFIINRFYFGRLQALKVQYGYPSIDRVVNAACLKVIARYAAESQMEGPLRSINRPRPECRKERKRVEIIRSFRLDPKVKIIINTIKVAHQADGCTGQQLLAEGIDILDNVDRSQLIMPQFEE